MTNAIILVMFVSAAGCVVIQPSSAINIQPVHDTAAMHMGQEACDCDFDHYRESLPALEELEDSLAQVYSDWRLQDSLDWVGCCVPRSCIVPSIPVPGFWARWQERRNLPRGPEGAQFHPLPTRPMFAPRPVAQEPSFSSGPHLLSGSDCSYGQLPPTTQWRSNSPVISISETVEPGILLD
jgi:hypothetical protein